MNLPEGMTLEQLRDAMRAAVDAQYPVTAPGMGPWPYLEASDGDFVIVEIGEDKVRHPWTLTADRKVELGTGEPVIEKTIFEPVRAAFAASVESAADGPKKLRVRVFAAGETRISDPSRLPVWVDDDDEGLGSLQRLVGGMKVYAFRDASGGFVHLDAPGKKHTLERHEIGYLHDPQRVAGAVVATAHLHDDIPDELAQAILSSADPSLPAESKPVGLSIDAACSAVPAIRAGKAVRVYKHFRNPEEYPASIDVVSHPAARGEFLERVAAALRARGKEQTMTPEQIAALEQRVTAAEKAAEEARVKAAITTATAEAETIVRASALPAKAQAAILEDIRGRVETDATVRASVKVETERLIQRQRDILAEVDTRVIGGGPRIEMGSTPRNRAQVIIDRMILGPDGDETPVGRALASEHYAGKKLFEVEAQHGLPRRASYGPRGAIRFATGIDPADWRTSDAEFRARIKASVDDTNYDDTFADRMHKIMLIRSQLSGFREKVFMIARRVSLTDFRSHDFVSRGVYKALTSVSKRQPIPLMETPSDQGHAIQLTRYAGAEDTAYEDIVNDDRGVVVETPMAMVDSYWRTMWENTADQFLLSALESGAPDYDSGTAWCASGRGNRGTTAFADAEINVVWKAMAKQKDFFATDRVLGLRPKRLLHPIDLAKSVNDILKPGGGPDAPGNATDYSFARSIGLQPVLVDHWTNTTDHVYTTDPNEFATAVVAFLNGNPEPSILVQDAGVGAGSWYDRRVKQWQVEGAWKASIVRHEGLYGENV